MRSSAVIFAIATAWLVGSAAGQTAPEAAGDVYVLRIDDTMIEALRQGQSLESQIDPTVRGRIGTVRIEYVAPPRAVGESSIVAPSGLGDRAPADRIDSNVNGNSGQPPASGVGLPINQRLSANVDPSANSRGTSSPPPLLPWSGTSPSGGGASTAPTAPGGGIFAPRSETLNSPPNGQTAPPIFQPNAPRSESAPNAAWTAESWLFGSSKTLTPLSRPSENERWPSDLGRAAPATGIPAAPTAAGEFPAWPRDGGSAAQPSGSRDGVMVSLPPLAHGISAGNQPPATAGAEAVPADSSPSQMVGKVELPTTPTEQAAMAKAREHARTMWYLFLLLMCSVGLNLYLGWIARGFYVRYQELAVELRDTFAVSSAA